VPALSHGVPRGPRRSQRSRSWRAVEFAALDFETTGLDRERDAIVSFGVVPVRGGRLIVGEAVHQLVVPEVPSSAESMRIHGILPKDLDGALPLPEAAEALGGAGGSAGPSTFANWSSSSRVFSRTFVRAFPRRQSITACRSRTRTRRWTTPW
jgi:hypothetical protein